MDTTSILVITGASGAGKTAAVRLLEARAHAGVRCHYFDTIGVPDPSVMEREFGSPQAWQLYATRHWIDRLAIRSDYGVVHVLEGQTRPSFVVDAARDLQAVHVTMVLLDASSAVRSARLARRGQPELANADMDRWAAYLRQQADALGVHVINTDALTVAELATSLTLHVNAARARTAGHP